MSDDKPQTMGSLNASLAQKMAGKFDPRLERTLLEWMSSTLQKPELLETNEPLQQILKDGTILCRLINTFLPGVVKRVNTSSLPFKQMENISNYVSACEMIGLSESERFQTLDLFEAKDIVCVMNHLRTLKILVEKNKGDLSGLVSQDTNRSKRLSSAPAPSPVPFSKKTHTSSLSPQPQAKKRWSVGGAKRSSLNQSTVDSPSVSSLHDDISTKEEFKYSPELEDGAKKWLRQLLNDETLFTKESMANQLKNGVLLCKVINTIQPGTITKINTSSFNYAQMENIGNYLTACVTLGLPKTDLFDTPDLWDKKNMNLVINNIHVLAKHVENKIEGYTGPKIGDSSQVRTLYSSALSEKQLSSIMGEDIERELTDDEQEMVDWMNSQLAKRDKNLRVPHLSAHGIRTGVILIQLLEIITKMDTIGFYEASPQILWHCMQNASLILRFIYQQTFVELDCKAQEIVLGRVESLIALLRFLRDKFDVDYLFLTVLNEGEEDKLSLADMVENTVEDDKESKAEREKIALIEAEIAKLQQKLEKEEKTRDSPRKHGNDKRIKKIERKQSSAKLERKQSSAKLTRKREKKEQRSGTGVAGGNSTFGGAIVAVASASDQLQNGEPVKEENLHRPHDMDNVVVKKVEKKSTPFDKLLSNITETGPKKPLLAAARSQKPEDPSPELTKESPKQTLHQAEQEEQSKLSPNKEKKPEARKAWTVASKPSVNSTDRPKFTMHGSKQQKIEAGKEVEAEKLVDIVPPVEHNENNDGSSKDVNEESSSEEETSSGESTEESSGSSSSEYSSSEDDSSSYDSSDTESSGSGSSEESEKATTSKAQEIEQTQKRIKQLHKDQEEAAMRARKLQDKKAQKPTTTKTGNEQTKERVLKAQNVVRKKVATELLQTEQNYIKSIEAVNSGLMKPLRSSGKTSPILKKDQFRAVFANLQELLKAHKEFLRLLEDRISENWGDQATVGDIFIQKMNIFRLYRDYLVNYNISIVALQSLKQNNNGFKALVSKFQRIQMRTSRLSLESFLIMPVQRIPRYLLLLADIKKYTAQTHPDFEFLTLAIDTLKNTMQSHNSGIDPKASQYAQKLLAVASSIENVEAIPVKYTQGSLVQSGRRLVLEGRVKVEQKISGKVIPSKSDLKHYCFLFNDVLLLCNEKDKDDSEHPFVFLNVLPTAKISASKQGNKEVVVSCENTVWNLKFPSGKTRNTWNQTLNTSL